MEQTLAFLDCFSGAAGDMILAAFVDAGLPLDDLARDVNLLPCGPIALRAEAVSRCGLRATRLHVDVAEASDQPHRGLRQISDIINSAPLPDRVKQRALSVFERLAEAEAAVHGMSVEEVHFHEVGALDAIADIVGAACALERLKIDRLLYSTLPLGRGSVQTAHGTLPVPAPATAKLVTGLRTQLGPVDGELLTPTAAAILTALGEQHEPPPLRIERIGYGAGSRDMPNHPNVLRVLIGPASSNAEADTVWLLEANLDDTTPEICAHAVDRLLAAGAVDAYVLPIQMKKSRPGILLAALAPDEALARVEDTFFRETTTFGVRRRRVQRTKLAREMVSVETPHGPVRVKIGRRQGRIVTASPEFEDCRRIALAQDLPLRQILDCAKRECLNHLGPNDQAP